MKFSKKPEGRRLAARCAVTKRPATRGSIPAHYCRIRSFYQNLGKLTGITLKLITEDLFKDNGSIPQYLFLALDSKKNKVAFELIPPQSVCWPGWL